MAARNRLLIELRESQRLKDPQVEFVVNEENLYEWTAIVAGPAQSPYENGRWKLRVTCPPSYPLAPPTVTFLTKCFHPNVDFKTGAVCLDILREGSWTPAWNIHFVCVAIAALLDQPNADSPLNCDADRHKLAMMMKCQRKDIAAKVRSSVIYAECANKFASREFDSLWGHSRLPVDGQDVHA